MNESISYVSIWPRLLALILDLLLFCLFFFPATRLIKDVWILSASDHMWNYGLFITDPLCITFLVIMFIYFVVLEGYFGATVGKWIAGIKVRTNEGETPGIVKSFLRNVLRIVDGLPVLNILGVILILTSDERKRFGDRIAGTMVIHSRNRKDS